jgi:hypothetical protein
MLSAVDTPAMPIAVSFNDDVADPIYEDLVRMATLYYQEAFDEHDANLAGEQQGSGI